MVSVFFSYSHQDEALRNQLEKHLSALRRQGVISTWHDRRIGAGKEFKREISQNLEQAEIILLLISPDFIASDYCYDIEMERAIERHKDGTARVIPVILRPCDWKELPFGELQAAPTDGKPVTRFPDQDEAFLDVTNAIKNAIREMTTEEDSDTEVVVSAPARRKASDIRSSNLRVKKSFSDREKEQFIIRAFEFIAEYFEGSLRELERRNSELEVDFRRIDAEHFIAAIYRHGSKASSCRVWIGRMHKLDGIAYANSDTGNDSSFNERLTVTDDGYSLLLKPLGLLQMAQGYRNNLTPQGGAEYLWSSVIAPLQR